MKIEVFQDKKSLAQSAATDAAEALRKSIQKRGSARLIAATGAAQFDFLELLTQSPEIDWSKVEMFHLDEYIGISARPSRQLPQILAGAADQQDRNQALSSA